MATVYGTAQKVHTAITSSIERVRSSVISSEVQTYKILSKCEYRNATRQRERKKKNTAKLRGFGYPRSSKLHTRCTRTKRCRSITDNAKDIQNDAQSITCDEETSTRCTKHHVRCTSIYMMPKHQMTCLNKVYVFDHHW